jgi:site-specific recombinase XerC
MGRRAKGPQVRWRGTHWQVYFTIGGERHYETTGITSERARSAAERRGREIYQEALAWGARRKRRAVSGYRKGDLKTLLGEWLEEHTGRPVTITSYTSYSGFWLGEFRTLENLTSVRIGHYVRRRLKQVLAQTLRRELSALRSFLRWLVAAEYLGEAPEVPLLKRGEAGTRSKVRHRCAAPEISPEEIDAILDRLPERSTRDGLIVRARFVVEYETALRPATIEKLRVPDNYTRGATQLVLTEDDDKSRYGRAVPLTDRAREALESVVLGEGVIFGEHRGIERYLRDAAKGILDEGRREVLCPQHLRSAAITHALERSQNLAGVQYLAGHRKSSTTERYCRPSFRAGLEVVDTLNRRRR